MFTKVPRWVFLKQYRNFVTADSYHNKYFYPDTYDNYILYAEAKSTVGLCNKVSAGLTDLARALGYDSLNFLGDNSIPWLFREHDYKPVDLALKHLANNKVGKKFNGAIKVNIAHLPEFTKHLFWLVRCNGVVFYPHFSDPGFNIMGSICNYGNFHFSTLNKATDIAFNEAMNSIGLYFLEEPDCSGSEIPGRQATYTAGN
jgi:hypothetical protein